MVKNYLLICLVLLVLVFAGCSSKSETANTVEMYTLNANAAGCMETVDNVQNLTVVSNDENVLRAEYYAGFIQGKLQRKYIISARDNSWDAMYLLDPDHNYPQQIPPSQAELARAKQILTDNFEFTANYIDNLQCPVVKPNLQRLVFRMLGIYHGTRLQTPAELDFTGNWTPNPGYFEDAELEMGYETSTLSWNDLYFLNNFCDFGDIIAFSKGKKVPGLSKCTAFVKKTGDDIIITHNTWSSFLSQTMMMNIWVNGDFITVNTIFPGMIGSFTDFGYNNKGIMFNETTHHETYSEVKVDALWSSIRAAAAEQFASSIDEFFEYISLDNSGTYLNGYMIIDAKTREIGLVEMSYKCFVFYKPNGDSFDVTTKPEGFSTLYDTDLIRSDYILGINYPASYQVRDDLHAVDNRPARKRQLMEMIGGVVDIETAKNLITYTDPQNPLSIFGRWDLGYGETDYPKTIPDGSIDAKAASVNYALEAMNIQGILDITSPRTGFWMKYGTPYVNGSPFIWSTSQWNTQKLRDVPDRVDGNYQMMKLFMR